MSTEGWERTLLAGYGLPMPDHPDDQVAVLQERLRQCLDRVRDLDPDGDEHAAAAEEAFAAAQALIDYEEQVPGLLDQLPRRGSLLTVRWSGVVTAALGVSLVIAALAGWTARWWLPLGVVPAVAGTALLWRRGLRAVALLVPIVYAELLVAGSAGMYPFLDDRAGLRWTVRSSTFFSMLLTVMAALGVVAVVVGNPSSRSAIAVPVKSPWNWKVPVDAP